LKKILLVIVIFFGFLIRFYDVTRESVWFDEVFSILTAEKSLNEITQIVSHDAHPPLYFYLLHFWIKLFGDSIFSTRMLSVIIGTSLVLVTYLLASTLFGNSAGFLSALLIVINPFLIYFSQETRMYILASLFTALSILFFVKLLNNEKEKTKRIESYSFLYCLFAILSLWTHYYTVFAIVAENLFLVFYFKKYKSLIKRWISLQLIVIISFMLWFYNFLNQVQSVKEDYWISNISIMKIVDAISSFCTNHSFYGIWQFHTLFFVIVFFVSIIKLYKKFKVNTLLLLILFILPLFLPFFISLFFRPVYLERYLTPYSIIFLIIIAGGVSLIDNKKIKYGLFSGLMILNIISVLDLKTNFYKGPMAEVDKYVKLYSKNNDLFYHTSIHTFFPFLYYNKKIIDKIFLLSTKEIPFYNGKYLLKERSIKSKIDKISGRRIWFFYYPYQDDKNIDVKDFIKKHCKILLNKIFYYKTSWLYTELFLVEVID